MVALIYTIINAEVQREVLRSIDRCLTRRYSSWQQPNFIHNYLSKLENERLYSFGSYHTRSSLTPVHYRSRQSSNLIQLNRCIIPERHSLSPSDQ